MRTVKIIVQFDDVPDNITAEQLDDFVNGTMDNGDYSMIESDGEIDIPMTYIFSDEKE